MGTVNQLALAMLCLKLITFALASLALVQANEESFSGCPNNFTPLGDTCLLVSTGWNSWQEADQYCRSLKADLLSIETPMQLALINDWLPLVAPYQVEFWTGGNCLAQKGVFYWQSTGAEARYLPWAKGEPLASAGDCLVLYASISVENGQFVLDKHRLKVKNCTQWAPVICETKPKQ